MHNLRHIRTYLILAFILPCLFITACKDNPPAAPPTSTESVTGIARDEQGYIIPNAFVEVFNTSNSVISSDITDDNGIFTLTSVPVDHSKLSVRVTHTDFKPFNSSLESLTGGGGNGLLLPLTHIDSACGRLSLTISDINTLAPISGAEVKLRRNGVLVTVVTTDSTGHIDFNYLIAGEYSLRISKQGYNVAERGFLIQFCDTASLDIRMTPSTTIPDSCCQGILRIIPLDSATNNVLVGATVKLTKTGMTTRILTSTQNGVEFREMCPGAYEVRIFAERYKAQEFGVTIGCNQELTLTRLMIPTPVDSCCFGVVTVIVQDSLTNNALQNALVKLWKNGSLVQKISTNANGGVTFNNLCPGNYAVDITREGYKAREFAFTLGCNEQYSRTIMLLQQPPPDTCYTATLKLRVKDLNTSAWIQGATVTLTLDNNTVDTGATDIEGWYIKNQLRAPGTYTVTISKTGYQTQVITITFNECKIISETIKLSP